MKFTLFIICFFISFGSLAQETEDYEDSSIEDTAIQTSTDDIDENEELIEKYKKSIKQKDFTNSAILRGLNKITARSSDISITIDEPINFSNLTIKLHSCWKAPLEELPENKALIQVWEEVPGEERKEIFYDWIFSSSPSISSLEHPVYDISLISCQNKKLSTPN